MNEYERLDRKIIEVNMKEAGISDYAAVKSCNDNIVIVVSSHNDMLKVQKMHFATSHTVFTSHPIDDLEPPVSHDVRERTYTELDTRHLSPAEMEGLTEDYLDAINKASRRQKLKEEKDRMAAKKVTSEEMVLQFRYSKDDIWNTHGEGCLIVNNDNINESMEILLKVLYGNIERDKKGNSCFIYDIPEDPEPEVRVLKTVTETIITETVASYRKGAE